MLVDINKISPKGLEISDKIALDGNLLIERESFFVEDTGFHVTFQREGKQIKTTGNIKTTVSIPCVRCLEHFEFKIDSNFDLVLLPVEMLPANNYALDESQLEYLFFEGERIDVAEIIMEQVNLPVPVTPICNTDCRGLCPGCGANLNNNICQCEKTYGEMNFLLNGIKR